MRLQRSEGRVYLEAGERLRLPHGPWSSLSTAWVWLSVSGHSRKSHSGEGQASMRPSVPITSSVALEAHGGQTLNVPSRLCGFYFVAISLY